MITIEDLISGGRPTDLVVIIYRVQKYINVALDSAEKVVRQVQPAHSAAHQKEAISMVFYAKHPQKEVVFMKLMSFVGKKLTFQNLKF